MGNDQNKSFIKHGFLSATELEEHDFLSATELEEENLTRDPIKSGDKNLFCDPIKVWIIVATLNHRLYV